MKPFIRVRSRILNTAQIQRIEVEGPNLVNVYLVPDRFEQFTEDEAGALLDVLQDYVKESQLPDEHFNELVAALENAKST
jgi:hypothetical protein